MMKINESLRKKSAEEEEEGERERRELPRRARMEGGECISRGRNLCMIAKLGRKFN